MTPDQHPPQSFFEKLKAVPSMRPKWRFLLDHIAVGTALVFVAVGLVYIGSFITFLWRSSLISALPTFGREGYGIFVRVFPWWHVIFIVIGIIAFLYVLRRHTFLFRWPLAVTIGVFLLAFMVAAYATDSTRVHDRLANRSIAGRPLPLIGPLYRGQSGLTQGIITAGEITGIGKDELTIKTDEETLKVIFSRRTIIAPNWTPAVGEEIVVLGKRDGSTITADGIHRAAELPNRRPYRIFREEVPPPSFY